MARDGSIAFPWAGRRRRFRLAWGELIALQEIAGIGPFDVLRRSLIGDWRLGDMAAIIALGLTGGGMAEADAWDMVAEHVEGQPPAFSVLPAQAILQAALSGADDEQPGKATDNRSDGRIKAADLYAAGAVIGFTPAQVKACSIWEFSAAVNGWVAANSSGGTGLTQDDIADLDKLVESYS